MSRSAARVTSRTFEEIAGYRQRYAPFLDEIARDLHEFLSSGTLSRAKALASATGQHLNHTRFPQFFTGDLDAELVLVHLNPQQPDDPADPWKGPFAGVKTFEEEEYFDLSRHFGERMYGVQSSRTHRSRFDPKQIEFLRPFGVVEFAPGTSRSAIFTNLERVIDHKLQLELIPYGSSDFKSGAFSTGVLRPHFGRVIQVITARPRRYVLFCGRVFAPLLRDFIVKTHRFTCTKKDGQPDSMTSEFANLLIPSDNGTVTAGWCRSWARHGLPMPSYANEVFHRYRPA